MKELLKSLVLMLPNKLQIWINFRVRVGYFPNLRNPKSFNEKIQHRKLYSNNPLFTVCSDKYAVREYIKEKIGDKYLIPLLYVGDDISEEALSAFDCDFVVKTTHDSGGVIIVKKSLPIDYKDLVSKVKDMKLFDFGKVVTEPWYSGFRPKIIVEQMLVDEQGCSPSDYKFHVFNNEGEKKVVLQIDYNRTSNHNRTFYDEDFNLLPFSLKYKNFNKKIKKSVILRDMLEVAKKLSNDFDYVRVDLYSCKEKIYFGELTFAAESGFGRFNEKCYDFYMGSMWK